MVRAVLLALLVGLALPLGVAGAPTDGAGADAVAPSLHDVAVLTLNDSARSGFASPSMDVATAMSVRHEAAIVRLDRYALAERLDRAGSNDARRALLFEAATNVEIRIADLRDDERALRAAYLDREIDTATFARGLARLHARTERLRADLADIETRADAIPRFSMNSRVQLLESKLVGSRGPIRAHAMAAITGDAPGTRLWLSASTEGVGLAMIEDGRYRRVVHRADLQTPDTVNSFSLDAAASRAFNLYPVAYNDSQEAGFGQNIDGSIGGNIYLVQLTFPSGKVNAYLDDGTRTVFFEIQERRLDLVGPRPAAVGAANGTRLVVNRTYPGGPLQVAVTDNATGEPRSTTVYVDGHRVETGADGTVWTLAPSEVTYQVRAVGPGGNVTIDVRPLAVPSLGG